jgi:hypothetical protein
MRQPGAPGPDFRTWDTTNLDLYFYPRRARTAVANSLSRV